jgi:hypothetical protein
VSDLPSGIREVVDATTGRLVPPENTPGYAEAIVWLHAHRPEMRRLSEAARARVQHDFSIAAMTDRWLAAFPAQPPAEVSWPQSWVIQPPLPDARSWYYSPPMRIVRRLRMKLVAWKT